jgi:serine/threonine-protein kinase
MEYIDGCDIEEYLKKHPENINDIFLQLIEGFRQLERKSILHRDIRPQNIMVKNNGTVKIIDLGFGKKVSFANFDKSITLNWAYEPPDEFKNSLYDFKTEVYFVGKLFEYLLTTQRIEEFKYKEAINRMCKKSPAERIDSFFEINKDIQSNQFQEIEFDYEERDIYREFSVALFGVISEMEQNSKYYDDVDKIQSQLREIYNKCMLEESIPDVSNLINCFVKGLYYYTKGKQFSVYIIKNFIDLLRSSSKEKKNIILSNIHTKLDAIDRYDDDVPF